MPEELSQISKELIEQAEQAGYAIGDLIVSRHNEWYRVTGFEKREHDGELVIIAQKIFDSGYDRKIEYTVRELESYDYIKSPIGPEQASQRAIEAIQDPSQFDKLGEDQEQETDVTALVLSSGKERMLAYRKELDEAQAEIEIIRRSIEARVSYLTSYASKMRSYIKKMDKVLGIFELYLGVNEEIVQLAEGRPTPSNTPISLRQLILYMDEEVGDPTDGGIDWQRVEDFDSWLITNDNYKKILPEEKGVIGLRPSRRRRWHYSRFGPFLAVQENDYRFYLLIRNGENLYRIFTSVNTGPHMFPTKAQIDSILKDLDNKNIWGSNKEKLEDTQLMLARNALILKGLMERTPIFQPVDHIPNIEDPGDSLINFIHDGEMLLPAGRLSYEEWKAEMNSQIAIGSRILLSKIHKNYYEKETDRFLRGYSEYRCPDFPDPGVYQVENIIPPKESRYETREKLIILYNPGGTAYSGWDDWEGHDRKNRVSFIVYRDDYFVFNYDLLDLADIEFYLENRLDRKNYFEMIPMLWELRRQRLAELEYEKHLVNLICNQTETGEDQVWEMVKWWKTKNKWKRPIRKDDALALRMIKKKLKNTL